MRVCVCVCTHRYCAPEDRPENTWDSEVPINYIVGAVSLDPAEGKWGEGVSEKVTPLGRLLN